MRNQRRRIWCACMLGASPEQLNLCIQCGLGYRCSTCADDTDCRTTYLVVMPGGDRLFSTSVCVRKCADILMRTWPQMPSREAHVHTEAHGNNARWLGVLRYEQETPRQHLLDVVFLDSNVACALHMRDCFESHSSISHREVLHLPAFRQTGTTGNDRQTATIGRG